MPRKIEVTELCLRDGHQSLLATRMAMEDLAPVCEHIDKAGYWSAECWGGATYDACIRFLNEDPWERLRTFKKLMPNTRLQMLLRGQNLLGYRHYEDGVVDRFVDKAAENGMDVFRVFDALNDIRNLRRALEAVKKTGKHAQGTISYTISPLHTVENFVELAKQFKEMGCDSICIKDMAALLRPQPAYDLVRGIKEACGDDTTVHVHVHSTTGVTLVSLMKAIEAGADIVDGAISSLSLGPGHNPTEAIVEMLDGTGYEAQLDKGSLSKIRDYFAEVRPRYSKFESKFGVVVPSIFESQIPGGMLSNMENQLREQGAGDRAAEVLAQVPKVREVSGYPPLVTPSSQIVGTQAVLNVLMGEFKTLTGEFADLMLGYYGATAGDRDPKIVEAAAKHAGKEPIDCRPADLLQPEWDDLKTKAGELDGFNGSDEDVLTFAMFPQVAPKFFASRSDGPKNLAKDEPAPAAAPAAAGQPDASNGQSPVEYSVQVGDQSHRVTVQRV